MDAQDQADRGLDWEEAIQQRIREAEESKQLGLPSGLFTAPSGCNYAAAKLDWDQWMRAFGFNGDAEQRRPLGVALEDSAPADDVQPTVIVESRS